MGFSRQEYWSGLPFPSPGNLSDSGIEPESLMSPALTGRFFATSATMLLLLLSCISRVRLRATPWMAAHQAPLSLGSSRQEYWSGLPFPSPMNACMLSCFSRVQLCATPWTAAHQAPLSLGFSRQEHWSGMPFPSPVPPWGKTIMGTNGMYKGAGITVYCGIVCERFEGKPQNIHQQRNVERNYGLTLLLNNTQLFKIMR